MRVLILVKGDAAAMGDADGDLLARMGAYMKDLVENGIMKDGAGLAPSDQGARVALGTEDVTDGPFQGMIVSGYWIWEVPNMETATDWAKRCPTSDHGPHELELRPFEGS